MQILDIRITPAAEADAMSHVLFVGEGGEEVAVTIANHDNDSPTVDQELVAKAKVMMLHAAAAQMRDEVVEDPEAMPAPDVLDADEDPGLDPLGEDDDNPFQNPDEALPDDDAEAAIDESMDRTRERFGA